MLGVGGAMDLLVGAARPSSRSDRRRRSAPAEHGDVDVTAEDHPNDTELAKVPLTSVAQPRHLLRRTAVAVLLAQARGTVELDGRHLLFEPELVVRTSTLRRPPGT